MPMWRMPGTPNETTLNQDYWGTAEGRRSIWQNFSDFFGQQQGANGSVMKSWFDENFFPEQQRWQQEVFNNPQQDMQFWDYLQNRQGGIYNEFRNRAPSARGQRPGFAVPTRELW